MKPFAIIGIDPGTTAAYAAIGLDGRVIKIDSAKELSLATIISEVMQFSSPLIVSTDKARTPSFVEEFARKVGAELAHPQDDMKKSEKKELLKQLVKSNEGKELAKTKLNAHEEDSLAAALFAYKKFFLRLQKIDRFVKYHNLENKREEFTKIALKEEINFSLIADMLNKKRPVEKIIRNAVQEEKITKKDFLVLYEKLSSSKKDKQRLEEKIVKLKQQVRVLRRENKRLDKRSQNFDRKVEGLFKFKEERLKLQQQNIRGKNRELDNQRQELNKLKKFINQTPTNNLLKKLQSLSQEEFSEKNDILSIKENDFLLVENPQIFSHKIISLLKGKSVVIFSKEKIPKVIQNSFITANIKDKEIKSESDDFALIDKGVLEEKMSEEDVIGRVISEYKAGRKDEFE